MKIVLKKGDVVEIGGYFYLVECEGSGRTLPVIKRWKKGDPDEWEKICNDNTPITILDLSTRSFNALETANILTVGQVAQFGLRMFRRLRHLGPKSQKELVEKTNAYFKREVL